MIICKNFGTIFNKAFLEKMHERTGNFDGHIDDYERRRKKIKKISKDMKKRNKVNDEKEILWKKIC